MCLFAHSSLKAVLRIVLCHYLSPNIYVVFLAYFLSVRVCVCDFQKTVESSLTLKSTVVFWAYILIGQKRPTKWRRIKWDENKHILIFIAHEFLMRISADRKKKDIFTPLLSYFPLKRKCWENENTVLKVIYGFIHNQQLEGVAFATRIICQSALWWCAIFYLFFNHYPVGSVTTPLCLPVSIKLSQWKVL